MDTYQNIHQSEVEETTRPNTAAIEARWLVVINHHEARVFRSLRHGTTPEQIRPRQTDESIRHVNRFDGFSRGHEKPADYSYFGPLADALKDARQFLVFGSGTGRASEMEMFVTWLHTHRPWLASRMVGTLKIDEHHTTPAQLLAHARDYFVPQYAAP